MKCPLQGDERARVIKFIALTFGSLKKLGNIDNDLPFRIEFYFGAIHWTWCRTFKINAFTVVTTTVAWALKLVFAGAPVGSAAQVRATSVDHKNAIGSLIDPDAILLLPLCIDAE